MYSMRAVVFSPQPMLFIKFQIKYKSGVLITAKTGMPLIILKVNTV